MRTSDVLVIGAGLAGMTAAVRLSHAGYAVTVVEAHPYIGGRTASWRQDGMHIETGLHRFLGFYKALPEILQVAGVAVDDIVAWEDEIEIRTPQGRHATLGLSPLHKPFKTFWNTLGHTDFLPPSDKVALAKMFAAAFVQYKDNPLRLDTTTVGEWAERHGVSKVARRNIVTPLTEGIFFVPPERYSMHNLMGLFVPYLSTMHKLRVGAFKGAMSDVMMAPMVRYVQAHRGMIITDAPIVSLRVLHGVVVGAATVGGEYRARQTIVATSLWSAQRLIRGAFDTHPYFAAMLRLPTMPAVTFQLELRRPAMPEDRTTFGPGTILASFAEQSRTTFSQSKGRLSVILAQPDHHMDRSADSILQIVLKDAAKLAIPIRDRDVLAYRKVALPHDFYALTPGSEALRPPQHTPVPGLTLAGDYTKQPYLATMEGAVVSGNRAAAVVARELAND